MSARMFFAFVLLVYTIVTTFLLLSRSLSLSKSNINIHVSVNIYKCMSVCIWCVCMCELFKKHKSFNCVQIFELITMEQIHHLEKPFPS